MATFAQDLAPRKEGAAARQRSRTIPLRRPALAIREARLEARLLASDDSVAGERERRTYSAVRVGRLVEGGARPEGLLALRRIGAHQSVDKLFVLLLNRAVAYVAPGPRLLDCAADEACRSLMQRLEIAVGEPAAVSSPKRHEVALPAPATEAQALIHTQPDGSLVAKFAVA